ncbi:MAG TPA: MarR family transcriptional regulator [Pyrinomonadaceae bacterium]|jgi:DNA-binding MarR family transcriptional regulator|nr:MarR family transcriptional regulator [Pyrinomonadaceae bacterium]
MANTPDSALLREVARLHLQLQRACVASCGDTGSTQCFILGEIYRSGSITLAELGRRLALDKGWVSRAVESLVQDGLLVKESHSEDRRAVVISLSKVGQKRYKELDDSLNAQVEQVMSHIPEKQRPGIYEALRLLRDALRTQADNESSVKARKAKCAS